MLGGAIGHRRRPGCHVRSQPSHVGGHLHGPGRGAGPVARQPDPFQAGSGQGLGLAPHLGPPSHDPCGRVVAGPGRFRRAHGVERAGPGLRDPVPEGPGTLREQSRAGHVPRRAGGRPFPAQRLPAARRGRGRLPGHPLRDRLPRGPGAAAGRAPVCRPTPWPGAVHRSDGLGQVDHAGRAGRHHQRLQAPAHHVGRGPDRVPAPSPHGRREPKGGR